MKRKVVLGVVFLVSLTLACTVLTGCHGNYEDSEQYEESDVIIEDNKDETHDDTEDSIQTSGDMITVTDASIAEPDLSTEDLGSETTLPYEGIDNPAYEVFENALFIGDSRTEGLQLYSGIRNADFFCAKSMTVDKINDGETVYAVGGLQVSIYDVLSEKQYRKVYIGLGINELGMKYVDDFVSEYNELIATIKEMQPDADIYIQALIPVTQEKSESHEYINNAQIYWYNTHIVQIAEENGVNYINADTPLVDETGALNSEATTDGVHMNREYCVKWANRIAELSQ